MARTVRKSGVKEVPLSEIKDDLSRYLREAERQEIVITRHGRPAGVLIGFESEEDWFDYRLAPSRSNDAANCARDFMPPGRVVLQQKKFARASRCLLGNKAPLGGLAPSRAPSFRQSSAQSP